MTDTELLNTCRIYFQQSQQSWKVYFSKWEALAKEEKIDASSLCEDSVREFESPIKRKRRISICRKIRNKSMAALNKKKSKGSDLIYHCKLKEKKKSHRKNLVRKSKIKIMSKTENKANLECKMLNIKYSELDLKAIFIEILSENARNNEIFTVLSRMVSKNIDSIRNFSFGSTIMEKNELAGNFVNNVNSEMSHFNNISSRRSSNNEIELKCDPCKSVRFPNSSRTRLSDFQQSDYFELREQHGSGNQNFDAHRNYFETNSGLTFGNDRHSFGVNRYVIKKNFDELQVNLLNAQLNKKLISNDNDITPICSEVGEKAQSQSFGRAEGETNSYFLRKFMLDESNSYLRVGQYLSTDYNTTPLCFSYCPEMNHDNFKTSERLVFESYATKSCFDKNVFKIKNIDPSSFPASTEQHTVKNKPRKKKRSRSSNLFDFSDDSEDDEKDGKNKNPTRFLKIYCTPTRSRQLTKKEKYNSQKTANNVSDDEDFTILDRMK